MNEKRFSLCLAGRIIILHVSVSYGLSDIDMPGVKTMCFSSV